MDLPETEKISSLAVPLQAGCSVYITVLLWVHVIIFRPHLPGAWAVAYAMGSNASDNACCHKTVSGTSWIWFC